MEVGNLDSLAQQFVMKINYYSMDDKGNRKDQFEVNYVCEPNNRSILMIIMPFADPNDGSSLRVDFENSQEFYPSVYELSKKLSDVTVTLSANDGLLSMVPNKNTIKIYDRQLESFNSTTKTYNIKSKMNIKVTALGLTLKTFNYSIMEVVSKQVGIIKQTFKRDNGEYFVITLRQTQ